MRLQGERLDRLIATTWELLGSVCGTTGPEDAYRALISLKRKRVTTPFVVEEPCKQFFVEKSGRLIVCYIMDAYLCRSASKRTAMLCLFGVVYEQSLVMWRVWASTGGNWSNSSPDERIRAIKGAFLTSIAMQLDDSTAYIYITDQVKFTSRKEMSDMIFGFCESINFTFSKGCYNYGLNASPQFAFMELIGQSLFTHYMTIDVERAPVFISAVVAMILRVDSYLTCVGAPAEADFFEMKKTNATTALAFTIPLRRQLTPTTTTSSPRVFVPPCEVNGYSYSTNSSLSESVTRDDEGYDCIEGDHGERNKLTQENLLCMAPNLAEQKESRYPEASPTVDDAVTISPSISSGASRVHSAFLGAVTYFDF